MTTPEKETTGDIKRLGHIVNLFREVFEVIDTMTDEQEYKRARDYIDNRFDVRLPYEADKFKKEANTEN